MSETKAPYRIEGRPPTIFRTVKNKDNPYVMIDRRPLENPMLSFKAKGILAYLLSRPDGWEVSITDLVNRGTDGAAAIRTGLKELRAAHHMSYQVARDAGRITGWLIEVYEVPEQCKKELEIYSEEEVLPDSDFQQVENQQVENRTQVLSTLSNNELKEIVSDDSSNQKSPEKKGDLVDAVIFYAAQAKAQGVDQVENILDQLDREFHTSFPRTPAAQSVARFILAREKAGEKLDAFVAWARRDEFNAGRLYEYAERPDKIRTRWPQAFAIQQATFTGGREIGI